MVAWWPLDEPTGPIAEDLVGDHDGDYRPNLSTGPTPVLGYVDGALSFDGVDDYVEVQNATDLNFGIGDFSIDMWVKTTANSGIQQLVDKRTGPPLLLGYSMALLNGSLIFQLADNGPSGGFTNYFDSSNPDLFVADGDWHFVAASVGRGLNGLVLYVDGNSQTFNPIGRAGNIDNTANLWIGARHPISTVLYTNAIMDEIEIFNRALTPVEVQAIYQAGSAGKCKCFGDLQIDLATGVDDVTGLPIPFNSPDDTWSAVECDPFSLIGGPFTDPPVVLGSNPFPGIWATLPPSQWISSNLNGPNGDYCYETCFCVDDGVQNAVLSLSILADDTADVYVINALGVGLAFNQQPNRLNPTTWGPDPVDLVPGENCIEVVVHQTGGGPTGFAMTGQVTAVDGLCCLPRKLRSPRVGDDVCVGGTDNGLSCNTNLDCTGGGVCGLKSRYVSITPTNAAGTDGASTSIQVEIVWLGPPFAPGYRAGEIWWAGPEQDISNAPKSSMKGAALECTGAPFAQVWPETVMHLFGPPIVPGSSYNVRMCDETGLDCSDPLRVATGKWGDVVAPFGGATQPNFADISAMVDKFKALVTAPDVTRCDLVGPGSPDAENTVNGVVNFADISATVDAFRGAVFSYAAPECSP